MFMKALLNRFNTSNYELKRPLTKEKGKNVNERLNEG